MTDPPRDAPPPVYRLARAFGRFVLRIYFRKIEIEGAEQLRAPGPAIFAANHPQSITDPLVLGLGTPRMVHFVAHSGLFRNPLRRALLRGAGVVPVFRPHESEGAAEKNLTMFRACGEVLVGGGVIGIFPEGTSRDERRVERLKTGTARIALETEAAHGFRLGVRVVPVGIHFETPRRFRSRVLLRVGAPLAPREYATLYQDDPRRAVESFTRDLFDTLAARVVHVERAELGDLVENIEKVYREELLARSELSLPEGSRFLREAILAGKIAKAVGYFETRNPGELDPLAKELEIYQRMLARTGIPEALLRPGSLPSARRTALRSVVPLLVGLPLAAWGALWCGLPYQITRLGVSRMHPDPSQIHMTRLWVGLAVYALYYPPLVFIAFRVLGGWWAVAFLAGLVPAGFFAMAYGRFWADRKRTIRAGWVASARRDLVEELRTRRRRVIEEMDRLLEDYLRVRESVGP